MSQRVLVVDDDPDTLTLIGLVLKRNNFEAIRAGSGPEALDLLVREMPDLMILDVMMPRMDGYEVCRQIRANPRTAHLPIVMLTAKAQLESQVEAFRAGADDYVTKPVRPSELMARLQAILEHSTGAAEQPGGHVISVVGARGGVGATTLAVNLALTLTDPARTILADLEVGGMAAAHLGLNPIHGLSDLLARAADNIDRASVEAALTPHSSGLRVLAAADKEVDPAQASSLLNHLLSLCDVCLFDLGAGLGQTARAIAQRSNDLVVTLGSDRVTLAQASRVVRGLTDIGVPSNALKVVWINRMGLPVENAHAAIRAALGRDPAVIIEPAAEALYGALEQGQPLVIGQPDHPVAIQIRALAASLIGSA